MKKKNNKVRYPTKRGINLASEEERRNKALTVVCLIIAIAAVAAAVAKFGVLDILEKQKLVEQQYDTVHTQYLTSEKSIEEYDNVLLEYRTYSMDWMENDESGKYVSVARRDILDMIEREMRSIGEVTGVNITGDKVTVDMQGLTLGQISAMCTDIEDYDFVKSATVQSAKTQEVKEQPKVENENGMIVSEKNTARSDLLAFQTVIQIQRPEKEEG